MSEPSRSIVYKSVGSAELRIHLFGRSEETTDNAGRDAPPVHGTRPAPAIVFFHGGGWRGGTPAQFYPHCEHLARRGMIAMSVEYRLMNVHHTTPIESVEDAKSAIRWIRSHAADLGIDPERLAAGGGSAGGHLAAACGLIADINSIDDDLSARATPDALVLFNPVIDTSPSVLDDDLLPDRWQELSPIEHVQAGAPPALVMVGTEDDILPVAVASAFAEKMASVGSRCELKLYDGQTHGFFNYFDGENEYYTQTVGEMEAFLDSLGFLAMG